MQIENDHKMQNEKDSYFYLIQLFHKNNFRISNNFVFSDDYMGKKYESLIK